MSKHDDKLSSIPPLGRSVEEVQSSNANRVNPPAERDDKQGPTEDVPLIGVLPPAGVGVSPGVAGYAGGPVPIYPVEALDDDVIDDHEKEDTTQDPTRQ